MVTDVVLTRSTASRLLPVRSGGSTVVSWQMNQDGPTSTVAVDRRRTVERPGAVVETDAAARRVQTTASSSRPSATGGRYESRRVETRSETTTRRDATGKPQPPTPPVRAGAGGATTAGARCGRRRAGKRRAVPDRGQGRPIVSRYTMLHQRLVEDRRTGLFDGERAGTAEAPPSATSRLA